MRTNYRGHLVAASIAIVALVAAGTVGFAVTEPTWTLLDAFYTATVTISTVGMQTLELGEKSKWIVIALIFASMGLIGYLSLTITSALMDGQPQRWLRQKRANRMERHVIICGYGRTGAQVADEVAAGGGRVLIVENDTERAEVAGRAGHQVVRADATTDEGLRSAGVERAKTLVAVLDTDPKNVYIALAAKEINPEIHLVAVAFEASGAKQLKRVGVDRVISLRLLGTRRLAHAVLRPSVEEFLDVAASSDRFEFEIEQVAVRKDSDLVGTTLRGSHLRDRFGLLVIAIRRAGGETLFNPSPDEALDAGDTLVVIGTREAMERFEQASPSPEGTN